MALLIAFLVFLVSMISAIFTGYSMIIALLIGLVAFSTAAARKGFGLKELGVMALDGAKGSLIVIEVMCVIGFVTASWRHHNHLRVLRDEDNNSVSVSANRFSAFMPAELFSRHFLRSGRHRRRYFHDPCQKRRCRPCHYRRGPYVRRLLR